MGGEVWSGYVLVVTFSGRKSILGEGVKISILPFRVGNWGGKPFFHSVVGVE